MKHIHARLFWRAFVIVGLLSITLFHGSAPTLAQTPEPGGTPGLDVMLVIDESGSMWWPNDPPITTVLTPSGQVVIDFPGWRIVGAKLLAELLGVDQSSGKHRLSVITFGTDASLIFPMTAMQTNSAQKEFGGVLDKSHQNMGGTNITKTFELALKELDRSRAGSSNVPVLIFLSDGKCEPVTPITKEITDECNRQIRDIVQKEFKPRKYQVFTIGLRSEDKDYQIYKDVWQEIAALSGGEYYSFNRDQGSRDLVSAYVNIFQRLLKLPLSPSVPVSNGKDYEFTVAPRLQQAIFSIVKADASVTASIIRPDGVPLLPGDTGVSRYGSSQTESYSISRPQPGKWKVRLGGAGTVEFSFLAFGNRLQVDQVQPRASHAQGKPLDIQGRILDEDGKPQSPESLAIGILTPKGRAGPPPLQRDGNRFTARFDDTQTVGRYGLDYDGKSDTAVISDTRYVDVVPALWLRLDSPKPEPDYPLNQPMPVRSQLMLNTAPILVPDPATKLIGTVQLLNSDGKPAGEAVPLRQNGGAFEANLSPPTQGAYIVQTRLVSTLSTGQIFEDISEVKVKFQGVAVTATPVPPTPTAVPPTIVPPTVVPPTVVPTAVPPTPPPKPPEPPDPAGVAAALAALVALAGGGGLGAWLYTRPKLAGTLDFNGSTVPLGGKSVMSIGSDPRSAVFVDGEGVSPRHAELRATGSRKSPQVEIRSLDPQNPVKVNGLEVPSHPLQNGDVVEIGGQSMTYEGIERFDADLTSGSGQNPAATDDGWVTT